MELADLLGLKTGFCCDVSCYEEGCNPVPLQPWKVLPQEGRAWTGTGTGVAWAEGVPCYFSRAAGTKQLPQECRGRIQQLAPPALLTDTLCSLGDLAWHQDWKRRKGERKTGLVAWDKQTSPSPRL